MSIVLVADDLDDARIGMGKILEAAGHTIYYATSPETAIAALEGGNIDAAVLDFKLKDGSATDKSGLYVATNSDPKVPKILVTSLADRHEIMDSFSRGAAVNSLIVDFLNKGLDGLPDSTELQGAVRNAVLLGQEVRSRSRQNLDTLMFAQQKAIRRVDNWDSCIRLGGSAIFLAFAIVDLWHFAYEPSWLGIVFLIVLILTAGVVLSLEKRGYFASDRADRYHKELSQRSRFEQLLASTNEIRDQEARDKTRRDLILRAQKEGFHNEIASAELSEHR